MSLNEIEEEIINFKERPDTVVRKIEAQEYVCDELVHLRDFDLAKEEEFSRPGYQGTFYNIPVYQTDTVYPIDIDVVRKEELCKDCYSERMYDEKISEWYCPKCDKQSWLDKKRRKFFMLMGKL